MTKIIRIGIDTSKSVFVLHGVDENEMPVLRKKLRRREVVGVLAQLEPTRIGIEAGGAAHHWGRTIAALGHEVVLLPPQLVRPYVARNKNDGADADGILPCPCPISLEDESLMVWVDRYWCAANCGKIVGRKQAASPFL